jgi:hypothetical protein
MAKTAFKQGKFVPKYPKKYKGDVDNIIFRSGWERRTMQYLDDNPNIVAWSSEEVIIPYVSPIDGRYHRYFVDFYVEVRQPDNTTKIMLLEVKPAAQTTSPKKPASRKSKRYLYEVATYGVNQAKWEAAVSYCNRQGWEFRIITETELFGTGKKKNK